MQAFGWIMSTLVFQECYLGLNLAAMKNAEKGCFLRAPSSKGTCSPTPWGTLAIEGDRISRCDSATQHKEQPTKVSHPFCPPPMSFASGAACSPISTKKRKGFKAFLTGDRVDASGSYSGQPYIEHCQRKYYESEHIACCCSTVGKCSG